MAEGDQTPLDLTQGAGGVADTTKDGAGQAAEQEAKAKVSGASTRKPPVKKATPAKKSAAKKPEAKKPAAKRSTFPELKTEAACEKVMKQHLAAYKAYQVERDKNRNEKGMEKHRLGYRTYKNAYGQLLGLRKASGKGRRNAKG